MGHSYAPGGLRIFVSGAFVCTRWVTDICVWGIRKHQVGYGYLCVGHSYAPGELRIFVSGAFVCTRWVTDICEWGIRMHQVGYGYL